jgi:membrane-associated HD superfamily phosphohydrolase
VNTAIRLADPPGATLFILDNLGWYIPVHVWNISFSDTAMTVELNIKTKIQVMFTMLNIYNCFYFRILTKIYAKCWKTWIWWKFPWCLPLKISWCILLHTCILLDKLQRSFVSFMYLHRTVRHTNIKIFTIFLYIHTFLNIKI